jgi:hypothetical protein
MIPAAGLKADHEWVNNTAIFQAVPEPLAGPQGLHHHRRAHGQAEKNLSIYNTTIWFVQARAGRVDTFRIFSDNNF